MSIDKPGKGRRTLHPEKHVGIARQSFYRALTQYEGGQRYRPLVLQDVRGLWLQTPGPEHLRDAHTLFAQWVRLGEAERQQWAGAEAYIRKLEAVVGENFRCREEGKPANWLMRLVHADAARISHIWLDAEFCSPAVRDRTLGIKQSAFSLTIEVSTDGGAELKMVDLQRGIPIPFDRTYDFSGLGESLVSTPNGERFEAWESLRKWAVAGVHRGIDHLQQEHQTQTARYRQRNVVAIEQMDEVARHLVAWHWGRQTPPGGFKDRCVELRTVLSLDPLSRQRRKK